MAKQENPEHALGASIIADAFGPERPPKLYRRSRAANRN